MTEQFSFQDQPGEPEKIVSVSRQLARLRATTDGPSRRYDWWGDDMRKLLHERYTTEAIVDFTRNVQTPAEFADAVDALSLWLPQCDNGQRMATKYLSIPHSCRIDVSEMRRSLFDKVIRSGWVRDYDSLDLITDKLLPLLRPSVVTGALQPLVRGTPSFCDNVLEEIEGYPPDIAADTVWLLAALTDKGAVDETTWGKIGILRFNPGTSFRVTEEVWRRFVQEHRDIYAPVNEQAHMDTLAKYCYALIKRIVDDPKRNPKSTAVIRRSLKIDTRGLIERPLKPIVTLANLATEQANRLGGLPDTDGMIRPHEVLTTASRLSVGEAVRRILLPTHNSDPALRRQQLYTDSVHVEIIHELSALGADIQKTLDRGNEDNASG